jgi:hypothetical protein
MIGIKGFLNPKNGTKHEIISKIKNVTNMTKLAFF